MKYFVLDRVLLFLVSTIISVWYLIQVNKHIQDLTVSRVIILLLFGVLLIISTAYLCREVLLLPIDFIIGKKTKICYFHHGFLRDDYEFFKKVCCFIWVFGDGKENIALTFPTSYPITQKDAVMFPPTRKRIKITYYRFSKMIYSWELECEKQCDDMLILGE